MSVDPTVLNLSGKAARVIIADDHELAREGLKAMLSEAPEITVIGTATNGEEAIELCRQERPDLVLMDLRMPVLDGLEATRLIKTAFPRIPVLVITVDENPNNLFDAIKAGASGYLLKDAALSEIVDAIRQALHGNAHLSSKMMPHLIREVAGHGQEEAKVGLTRRERDVLQLVAKGKSNREIARELGVTEGTVKVHVGGIFGKLGVSDRTKAVVRAMDMGLIRIGAA